MKGRNKRRKSTDQSPWDVNSNIRRRKRTRKRRIANRAPEHKPAP